VPSSSFLAVVAITLKADRCPGNYLGRTVDRPNQYHLIVANASCHRLSQHTITSYSGHDLNSLYRNPPLWL
jgi:hypothetical protein